MGTKKFLVGFTFAGTLAVLCTAVTPLRAATVQVFAMVSCASASSCAGGKNSSTGPGIEGISAKGQGVVGQSNSNSAVAGNSKTSNGVFGQSYSGHGVTGNSSISDGLSGSSYSGNGINGTSAYKFGVRGTSAYSGGMAGISFNNDGIDGTTYNPSATTTPRSGVFGYDASTDGGGRNVGVAGYSSKGTGVSAASSGGLGAFITNSNGNGAEIRGTYIGALIRAPAGAFPLVATDSANNQLFIVNGNGDVSYHGTLNHFAATRNGAVATAYVPNTAAPTVEDSGTARLINGQAIVPLDNAFAQSIDASQPYQVMLTPGGDTRGLFVATKTPGEFVVRENQAGHGTLSFDYHIYAHAFAHAKERMVLMSKSAAASLLPRAKPRLR